MTPTNNQTTVKHDPIPTGAYKDTPPMKTQDYTALNIPNPDAKRVQSTSDVAIEAQNKERWVPVSTAIKLTGLSL